VTRDAANGFAAQTCTAPPERSDRMRDIVLEHVPRDRPIRLLDLGCGTGSLIFRLAKALPAAELVGIDVSPSNIASAQRRNDAEFRGRLRFVVADYLAFRDPLFDVIVSDGVLHLISASTSALIAKLAADLKPGGLLVCDMPYDCAYNRAFAAIRRGLRMIRSPIVDAMILAAGRLLHSQQMDDDQLRERVQYMYVPPERMMDSPLVGALTAAGLRQTATHPNPSTSPSQLRHNVTVWTKASAVA
jgi:SAM-dependent methyltransferase